MSINIEIDGLGDVLGKLAEMGGKLDSAVSKGVSLGGKVIQAYCKAECPVDTGELQNSIIEETSGGGGSYTSEVGPTAPHGIYVEMGTGIYAGGRQTPWTYMGGDGKFYPTRGQPPQPYMEPGFEEGKEEAVQKLTEEVRKALN